VNEEIVNRIALAVLRHLLSYEIPRKQVPGGLFGDWVVRKSFSADVGLLECRLKVRKKIVGVGAAAKAFLPAVADKLYTECVIPPYAEVANAVGTVAGNISQTVEALVRPQFLGSQLIGYLLTAPDGRQTFHSFEEAVERALTLLEQLVVERAREAGCREVTIRVERDEIQSGEVKEVSIRAIAMGRPYPSIAKEEYRPS
jgi:N-methylhydantoinase A/oxoprolinase/acetone carboxylase beta subunit